MMPRLTLQATQSDVVTVAFMDFLLTLPAGFHVITQTTNIERQRGISD